MSTHDREGLSPEQSFEPDGHLTELCLTCVSDGELALVPQGALDHLDACEPCARRLGEAALRSMAAGEALRSAPAPLEAFAPAPTGAILAAPTSPRRARRPLPIAAITAALVVAALTAGPALLDAAGEVPRALVGLMGLFVLAARLGGALARVSSSGLAPLLVKCGSALVLAVVGFQVARVRSRARSWQGGVQ